MVFVVIHDGLMVDLHLRNVPPRQDEVHVDVAKPGCRKGKGRDRVGRRQSCLDWLCRTKSSGLQQEVANDTSTKAISQGPSTCRTISSHSIHFGSVQGQGLG
jgi:hypothetical protein